VFLLIVSFASLDANRYTPQQFMVAELQVMSCLKCDVAVLTPYILLGPLIDAAESHPIEQQLAEFLLELSLLDPLMGTAAVDPPTLAAACLFLSRLTLLHAQRKRQTTARAVAAAARGSDTAAGGRRREQHHPSRSSGSYQSTSVTSAVSTSSSSSLSSLIGRGVGSSLGGGGGREFEWGGIFDVLGPTNSTSGESNGNGSGGGNSGGSHGSGHGDGGEEVLAAGHNMNAEDTDESDFEAPSESESENELEGIAGDNGGSGSVSAKRKTRTELSDFPQQDELEPPSSFYEHEQDQQQRRRRPANRPPELGRFAARAVDRCELRYERVSSLLLFNLKTPSE